MDSVERVLARLEGMCLCSLPPVMLRWKSLDKISGSRRSTVNINAVHHHHVPPRTGRLQAPATCSLSFRDPTTSPRRREQPLFRQPACWSPLLTAGRGPNTVHTCVVVVCLGVCEFGWKDVFHCVHTTGKHRDMWGEWRHNGGTPNPSIYMARRGSFPAMKDGACQIDLAGIGGVDGQKRGRGCRGPEQRVVGAA